MADQNNPHFKELFWFCCFMELMGILLLIALVWHPVPKENQPMANIAMGFDTATLLVVPIGYLLGGNPSASKPKVPDTTADNVNVSSNTTTVNSDTTEVK